MTTIFKGWIPPRSRNHKRERKFKPYSSIPQNPRMDEYHDMMSKCPSVGDGIGTATIQQTEHYENPEMAKREKDARNVKHTVAPICNKGGYQLITNEADIKTAGRKV